MARTHSYRHLNQDERMYFCEVIRSFIPIARNRTHSMQSFARVQISNVLWRWTADGYCQKDDKVKQDALKYRVEMLPATKAAHEIAGTKGCNLRRELRHEHVVPRMEIAKRIIEMDLVAKDIFALLSLYCKAVIVTKAEEAQLSRIYRSSMPDDWKWEDGCALARYRSALLHESIVEPTY